MAIELVKKPVSAAEVQLKMSLGEVRTLKELCQQVACASTDYGWVALAVRAADELVKVLVTCHGLPDEDYDL